jgi:hypothetical protein
MMKTLKIFGNLHGFAKCAEIFNLCAEYQVSKLCISKEYDEKHDSKASDICCATCYRLSQLGHCFVEACVLEDFHPCQEHGQCDHIIELDLPVAYEFKVSELVLIGQQAIKNRIDLEL